MNNTFSNELKALCKDVNKALCSIDLLKTNCNSPDEKVIEAENYALSAGGKRIRPILCLAFYKLFGGDNDISEIACCLELMHTFSLIHDDMPEMDNDDFRRGKPSAHKAFGEDIALLAGDGLAILPFEVISKAALSGKISYETSAKLINLLSSSAGNKGMIAGQMLDLYSEDKAVDEAYLVKMSRLKTGKLLEASCLFGAVLADADDEMLKSARIYAENIGLAFQMVDDVLDVIGDEAVLGKPVGSDKHRSKTTFADIYGVEGALSKARELTDCAINAIEKYSESEFLIDLAKYLTERNA
ncbi:MAG: polyprenyl synthetase family protein [Oscillospiraceae bacterium]|nr:polyprenyl synthetase family protein [Oscillospiraceae bacterium]